MLKWGSEEIVWLIVENFVETASWHQVESDQLAHHVSNVAKDTALRGASWNGHLDVELLVQKDSGLPFL